jgi:hypothetical protein
MAPEAPLRTTSGGGLPAKAIASTTRRALTFLAKGVLAVKRLSRLVLRTIRPGVRVSAGEGAGAFAVRAVGAAEGAAEGGALVQGGWGATRRLNKAGMLATEGTHIKLWEESKVSKPEEKLGGSMWPRSVASICKTSQLRMASWMWKLNKGGAAVIPPPGPARH